MSLSEQDKALIRELQRGFKLERRPFLRVARAVDMSEEGVIARVGEWLATGIIRRIGVAVRPQKMGNAANALVIWNVPADRIDEVGAGMARLKEISHCYERDCPPGWKGNLYTMIHARDEEHLKIFLGNLEREFGLETPAIYRTVRELKKTSMRYFDEERA
ncbi:MAG TPA: Lrp/AsnC family transcriptional regulator [Candidatus Ozemobacteraceae bacterium]